MNPSPLAILVIIAISAAVFGGIIFFGLRGAAPVTLPAVPGTIVRVPDILNLPGFGNNQNRQAPSQNTGGGSTAPILPGASGRDVVVEKSELPFPVIPAAPAPSRLPGQSIQIPPSFKTSTPPFAVFSSPQPNPIPAPTPVPAPITSAPRQTAATPFSVFKASPQLRVFREQMIQEGVIGNKEFTQINNNKDAEAFMLKLVEWQARKASSTPEQIQDALDRIKKAYSQLRSTSAPSGR